MWVVGLVLRGRRYLGELLFFDLRGRWFCGLMNSLVRGFLPGKIAQPGKDDGNKYRHDNDGVFVVGLFIDLRHDDLPRS